MTHTIPNNIQAKVDQSSHMVRKWFHMWLTEYSGITVQQAWNLATAKDDAEFQKARRAVGLV